MHTMHQLWIALEFNGGFWQRSRLRPRAMVRSHVLVNLPLMLSGCPLESSVSQLSSHTGHILKNIHRGPAGGEWDRNLFLYRGGGCLSGYPNAFIRMMMTRLLTRTKDWIVLTHRQSPVCHLEVHRGEWASSLLLQHRSLDQVSIWIHDDCLSLAKPLLFRSCVA